MASMATLMALSMYITRIWGVPILAKFVPSKCGNAFYDPAEYTCYDIASGGALCPVIYNVPTKLCGRDCYSEYQYSCNNITLKQLPLLKGPYVLTAVRPGQSFNASYINAIGEHFYLNSPPATYCPSFLPPSLCPSAPNSVFEGGSLAVEVPGGQQLYIQDDGALAFTEAHSMAENNVSYHGGGVAYDNAGYFGPDGCSWVACPTSLNTNGTGAYQVFANVVNVSFTQDCLGFYAVAQNQPEGTEGAWQYV